MAGLEGVGVGEDGVGRRGGLGGRPGVVRHQVSTRGRRRARRVRVRNRHKHLEQQDHTEPQPIHRAAG